MIEAVGVGVVVVVLALQGFFSGSEMALVSANRAKLEHQANEGSRGAGLALSMLKHEDQLLGTCLIGTNLSLITGATVVSALVLARGGPEWLAAVIFAPIALLFGEAVPKTVYQHHATMIAPVIAWPLRAAQLVFTPLLWIVGLWASLLRRLVGRDMHPSREELMMLLDADQGTDIDPRERSIIRRVLEMNDMDVEEAMTPLVEVEAVATTCTVADATAAVLRSGYSRILVYEDRIDNIIGAVGHLDLLYAEPNHGITDLIRSVPYVPETKSAQDLLQEMRSSQAHLSVVVDEYGGAVGIVTQEDLLEELVGEIQDERDSDEPSIRKLSDREWRVPGRVELHEVRHVIGIDLPEGDYETVAGLILQETGRIPNPGEIVRIGELSFLIEQGSERAIQQVRLTVPPAPEREP